MHRDLNPGNVMLTDGDKVKIVDFGLAKTQPTESSGANAAESIAESLNQVHFNSITGGRPGCD